LLPGATRTRRTWRSAAYAVTPANTPAALPFMGSINTGWHHRLSAMTFSRATILPTYLALAVACSAPFTASNSRRLYIATSAY